MNKTPVDWPCASCGKTTVNTERTLFITYGGMPMAYIHNSCKENKEKNDNY